MEMLNNDSVLEVTSLSIKIQTAADLFRHRFKLTIDFIIIVMFFFTDYVSGKDLK